MDSPLVSQLFRRLFQHHKCCHPRPTTPSAIPRRCLPQFQQKRTLFGPKSESSWTPRSAYWPADKLEEYQKYPLVTSERLRKNKLRPKKVKMLMRDFIEDSLYNPEYGYFSKHAVIFTPGHPFDFNEMTDLLDFQSELGKRYTDFEDTLDLEEFNESRQLWHTPTELFTPHYGEAIARCIFQNYLASLFPSHDLIIYEMGAGRGTLMLNILDYLRDVEPSIYSRCQYKIIEISSSLADIQRTRAAAASRGHEDRVQIINKSIFDWSVREEKPCFFLAMEVFDNFAHDCVRYDMATKQPLQARALIDDKGDFYEFYDRGIDDVAKRFFATREAATGGKFPLPYAESKWPAFLGGRKGGNVGAAATGEPVLSRPEYLPTRLMQFFDILAKYFPKHRLVTSDFHYLPNACEGLNAPVVQTRYQRVTVPVTTPLVYQGYFDILFPTDFRIAEALYRSITGKLTEVVSHEDFVRRWAALGFTQTKSGENALSTWYKNASVMITVS